MHLATRWLLLRSPSQGLLSLPGGSHYRAILKTLGLAFVPVVPVPLCRVSLPVHKVEVPVQVARIHSAFAQLQLGLGVVVHVVHTHLLQDAKPSLWHRQEGGGSRVWGHRAHTSGCTLTWVCI